MCLVRVSKEDDPVEPSRPVVYVRRRASVSHSTRTSQIIIRPVSTSHHSVTRVTSIEPAPRPAEYVKATSPHASPVPDSGNFPMIIQAPTPNRSPRNSPRTSHTHVVVYEGSPRNSRTSVHSRHSARQGSQRSRRDSRRHSRHNSGEAFIVDPPMRTRSVSPAVVTRGRAESHSVRHASASERSETDRSREPSRERRSKVYLTTPLSHQELDKMQRGLEESRDTMLVEEGRSRARSITYGANPRMSAGRLEDRERVLVEEDGRRREFYKTKSLSP